MEAPPEGAGAPAEEGAAPDAGPASNAIAQGFPQGLGNQIVFNQLPMLSLLPPSSAAAPAGGLDATTLTLQTLQGGDAEALYGNLGALQIIPTQYVLEGDAAGAAGLNLNGLNLVTIGGQQMLVPAMYLNPQLGGEQLQYVTTGADGSAGGDVLPPIMPLFVSPFTTDANQQVRAAAPPRRGAAPSLCALQQQRQQQQQQLRLPGAQPPDRTAAGRLD
jgi:hypothetical protein